MKHKLILHLMGILILVFCVSCGHSVKETVKPVVPKTAGDQFKRVIILPFADFTPVPFGEFTPGSSLYNDFRRRTALVFEPLQVALYEAGFIHAAPQEDIAKYLFDKGIIKVPNLDRSSAYSGNASLEQELYEPWSDRMKEELRDIISENQVSRKRSQGSVKTVALDREQLKALGKEFEADYIVRGHIVEFRTDHLDTRNPLRTGIVPCVLTTSSRTVFGVAETEPFQQIDMEKDTFKQYDRARALGWGIGGLFTGLIGEKQGRVPGATIQISVLVHDAYTGDVVWLNRAEAVTVPRTAWASSDADLLFPKAIEAAVDSLVNDFSTAYASGRFAKTAKKVSAPEAGESSTEAFVIEVAAEKAERSAEQAEAAAREAKESALKAGEAKEFAQNAENAADEAQKASGDAKDAVKRASEASVKSEKIFKKIIAK